MHDTYLKLRRLVLFAVVAASIMIGVFVASKLAETVFFDKFYYQKSIKYGYWPKKAEGATLDVFGQRSKDLLALDSMRRTPFIKGEAPTVPFPKSHLDSEYVIVIIGDSFVWGTGIKNRDRFPLILEDRLNAIAPTRVISLGRPGDGFVDNFLKYVMARIQYPQADLYVFGIVDNDLVPFRSNSEYNQTSQNAIIRSCDKPIYFSEESPIDWGTVFDERYGYTCIFHQILPFLPREKAVYFDYGRGDIFGGSEQNLQRILKDLTLRGFYIVSARESLDVEAKRSKKTLRVSDAEPHPNAQAHLVFADVLYKYISAQPYFHSTNQPK